MSTVHGLKGPLVKSILSGVRKPKPKGVVAHVDQIGPDFVRGWAADRDRPGQILELRVTLDGIVVAEGKADGPRADLKAAGYGEGIHAFQFPVPTKALFCAKQLTLAVVSEGGGETVVLVRDLQTFEPRSTPVLHLDASDLIEFLTHHRELSGIQRVQAGYLLGLGNATIGDAACRICTRLKFLNVYLDVPYERFAQLLAEAGDSAAIPSPDWKDHIHRFKMSLKTRAAIRPGDTVFTLGAPWALDQHNELVRCVKLAYGARYLQIFYDLIPISTPEVVPAPLIPHFARAMAAMSIYADHIFSISRYSMDDLAGTLRKLGRAVPGISVVPMGGTITDAEEPGARQADALDRLGVSGPFVLSVGTLEPRKNHMLLFQVWRRLVAKHGAANVPKLVLVGRVGWYMEDFMRMLKVTNFVDGTVVHLMGVSNAELSELYDACLFTVFPSFTEGWGLPITESLARGKICVCSNTTSMPEAGGEHAVYIDPYDTSAAFELCDTLIANTEARVAQEAKLRSTFRPQTWADASDGLRTQLADLTKQFGRAGPPASRKPIEFGRLYKFYNIEAAQPDASSTEVFRNFLDQEDALDLLDGWLWFDLDVNCTWACGPIAPLAIVPPIDAPSDLVAYIDVVTPPALVGVGCKIMVGGSVVGAFKGSEGEQRLMVPVAGAVTGEPTRVVFTADSMPWPAGGDSRRLGFGIRTVIVFARDDLAGRLRMWEHKFAVNPSIDGDASPERPSKYIVN